MSYSRTRVSRTANPPELAALTENLVAQVWHSIRSNGDLALHWGVARRNPHDSLRPYRSFHPESIFELPLFLAKLSFALAAVESLPPELRRDLEDFSKQVQALDTMRRSNGATEDPEPAGLGPILGKC